MITQLNNRPFVRQHFIIKVDVLVVDHTGWNIHYDFQCNSVTQCFNVVCQWCLETVTYRYEVVKFFQPHVMDHQTAVICVG